jgi:cytochrome c oxidase subunit 2
MTFAVSTRLLATRFRLVAVLTLAMLSFAAQARTSAQRIEIVAKRFEFTPSEITLKKGVPTVLVFRSDDVQHSIVINELSVKTDIRKNKTSEVELSPQKAGTFIGKCGHFCGSGHGRMKLTVHVVD